MPQQVNIPIFAEDGSLKCFNSIHVIRVLFSKLLEHGFQILQLVIFLLINVGDAFLDVKVLLEILVLDRLLEQLILQSRILYLKPPILLLKSVELFQVAVRTKRCSACYTDVTCFGMYLHYLVMHIIEDAIELVHSSCQLSQVVSDVAVLTCALLHVFNSSHHLVDQDGDAFSHLLL